MMGGWLKKQHTYQCVTTSQLLGPFVDRWPPWGYQQLLHGNSAMVIAYYCLIVASPGPYRQTHATLCATLPHARCLC